MENQILNENQIIYQIEKGDNLYRLAKKYHTTVEQIMALNPHLDPYNLQIGDLIIINTMQANLSSKEIDLMNKIRTSLEQQAYWTRLAIISILSNSKDEADTITRLSKSTNDIVNIYRTYYGDRIGDTLEQLFNEHTAITIDLIKAVQANDSEKVRQLENNWYDNVDTIATTLAGINPYYDEQALKRMFNSNLTLTKDQLQYRLNEDYSNEIKTFDDIEQENLMMADYLAMGITNQFANQF